MDVASNKSNKNSPITTTTAINSVNTPSIPNRNGGQISRGMVFLRNTFSFKNGGGGGNNTENDSTEYRKLQTKNEPTAKDQPNRMTVVGIEDNVGAIKRQNLSNGFVVSDKIDLDGPM